MGFGRQIKVLLYRNFLLKRRNSKQTIYEAVSVLYFVAILAVLRKFAIKPTTFPAIKDGQIDTFPIFETKRSVATNTSWLFSSPPKSIGYVFSSGSDVNEGNKVIKKVENYTLEYGIKFVLYQDEKALEDAHKANPKNVSMGLVIDIDSQKNIVNYTIKVPYGSVPLSLSKKRTTGASANSNCRGKALAFYRNKFQCPVNTYFSSWFSVIQSLVDNALIEVLANGTGFLPPQIKAKMLPKGEFKTPLTYFKTIVSIYMVMAFSPYIMFLLTHIVTEKEKKIKEAMKIMGLSQFAFWLSWFITYAVLITFGVIMVVIIARLALLFGNSDYFIIFIIFFLYGLSIETLAFSLTPLFQKAKSAGMAGSVCTIIISCLSMLHIYLKTSNGVKWLTAFLSPVALSLALTPAVESDAGITWSTVGSKGDFPASYGITMLFIDTILYLLLALYLDSVFPGEYGQRKHPLFCFHGSFWKNLTGKSERKPSFFRGHSVKEDETNVDVEEMPMDMLDKLVICVRKLQKVFKRGKEELRALDGVSLDVYEGQITALLGHNGAGKSTLIAALTGMLPVSGGRATVYGKSIKNPDDMDSIRQLIGLCPQQNIIFEELTPREHLKIFAGIKGIPSHAIHRAVNETLKEIDLWDKADSISKNLSGGQKRKLCVGMALIGDPKVIFLDEPTSGMDPSSRRYIWSLLQQKKEDRVIFLTTHFMDEADILADHKAVLVKGKLRCAGSSLFLKSRFGVGYNLSMVVEQDCDRSKLTDMVSDIVPGAALSRAYSKELAFKLPMKSVATFPDLFAALEKENNTSEPCCAPLIGVTSYGVSMTTLEEVFLRLDGEQDLANGEVNAGIDEPTENLVAENGGSSLANNVNMNEIEGIAEQGSFALLWLQLTALLEIRFWMSVRSPMKIIFQIIVPAGLLIAGLVVMRASTTKAPEGVIETITMQPSMYLKQRAVWNKDQSKALIQNKSHGSLNDVLNAMQDEQINYDLVNSIANAKAPHDLGFEIQTYKSASGQFNYILRYNDSSVFSIPVGISTMSNTAFRIALNKSGKSYNGRLNAILTNSKPFESVKTPWSYDNTVFSSIILIGLTFAFIPTGFSIEVVLFRQVGFRHQLRVCGVNRWIYWLQFFIGDIVLYVFPVLIVYILIPAFDLKAFNNSAALGAIFLLLLLYNTVNLLFSYVFSFGFNKWETLQNVSGTILIMASLIPYVGVAIVDMVSGDAELGIVAMAMHIAFCVLIPPYEIMGGLYFIHRIWRLEATIAQNNDVKIPASKYFELSLTNGVPVTLIILTLQIFIYSYLVAVLDLWKAGGVVKFPLSLCKSSRVGVKPSKISLPEKEKNMNEDVKSEIEKVQNICNQGTFEDHAVLVEGLTKDFGSKKDRKRVVDDVYLDVAHGEILGLLGPNGAGKTTTMNMITADFPANSGEVYLGGHNIKTELAQALQQLGYCPQADVVADNLTLKEHLKCYSLIKGVPRDTVDSVVQKYMAAMKITEHAETRAAGLSGGTKRKLCFLVSMCGSPGIVLMDEPSTGMDPASKRFLWTIASNNIVGDRGAILTTHSMEEADALCSRVGIIVKGQLKCIGTTQELKSNYGGGYSLELKGCINNDVTVDERMEKIEYFVQEMFSDATATERFGYRVVYKIPKENVGNLSEVFARFESGKSKVGIEEYSFSQSTLEQVFLEFAKWQDDDLVDKDLDDDKDLTQVASV